MNLPFLSLSIVRNSRVTENRNIVRMAVLSLKGGQNALCFFGQLSLTSKALCVFFHAQVLERVKQKKEKSWARRYLQSHLQRISKTAKIKLSRLKKADVFFSFHSFGGGLQPNPKKVAHPAQLQSKKKSGQLTSRVCRAHQICFTKRSLLFLKGLCLALRQPSQSGWLTY